VGGGSGEVWSLFCFVFISFGEGWVVSNSKDGLFIGFFFLFVSQRDFLVSFCVTCGGGDGYLTSVCLKAAGPCFLFGFLVCWLFCLCWFCGFVFGAAKRSRVYRG